MKAGFYSDRLSDEEMEEYPEAAQLKGVDDELAISRVRLGRFLRLQRMLDEAPDDPVALEGAIEERKTASGTGDNGGWTSEEIRTLRKRPPVEQYIDMTLGRIAQLVKLKHELEGGQSAFTPEEYAEATRRFLDATDALMVSTDSNSQSPGGEPAGIHVKEGEK